MYCMCTILMCSDCAVVVATSFPGSSLFLPRASTLVATGHMPVSTNEMCTEVLDLILSTVFMFLRR